MPDTPSVQTQATNLLGGIPFGNIIGGPLVAAIDAQGMAAMETVKFIQAVGFVNTGSSGTGTGPAQVQNVSFTYTKGGQEMQLRVPLLTIVPIPFIRINNMTIAFTANIQADTSNSSNSTDTSSFTSSVSGSAGFFFDSVNFNASYSNSSTTNSSANSTYNVQYTMNVNVNAVQDDMPGGLQTILNILLNAITPSGGSSSTH